MRVAGAAWSCITVAGLTTANFQGDVNSAKQLGTGALKLFLNALNITKKPKYLADHYMCRSKRIRSQFQYRK